MKQIEINYTLDTQTYCAFLEKMMLEWSDAGMNVFSTRQKYLTSLTADKLLEYFVRKYEGVRYHIFSGSEAVIWVNNKFLINLGGEYGVAQSSSSGYKSNEELFITYYGEKSDVMQKVKSFSEDFKNQIFESHFNVDWIYKGAHGPTYSSVPLKSYSEFHPEMYPYIKNINTYTEDFLNSNANVLIFTGDPGLGKSALINHIIHTAKKNTQVVYDQSIMQEDSIYAEFIHKCSRNNGGIFVIEDADIVLRDRENNENATMSKLLNISDGILDNRFAKFIFSANIKNVGEIDSALIRPGRCFDVVQFRHLNRQEAEIAANKIGKELIPGKSEYSVAEIYNQKADMEGHKIGF